MSDFRWQTNGGVLIDGTGDIAFASEDESMKDMIRTRLRAAIDGWKLYAIGADLKRRLGNANIAEMETAIQGSVARALSRDLLSPGTFEVETLASGESLQIFVYLYQQLAVSATLTSDGVVQV